MRASAVAAFLTLAWCAQAQLLVGSEHKLASGNMSSVTHLRNGGYVVVWISDAFVLSQKYSSANEAIFPEPVQVNGNGGEVFFSPRDPCVAGLVDGGYFVSWTAQDGDSDGKAVFAQVFESSGLRRGSEFRVNRHEASDQFEPACGALPSGGFVVMWHSRDQDGSGYGIYGQVYTAQGQLIGTEFLANTYVTGDQKGPKVAGVTDGFVVTWTSLQANSGTLFSVYAQLFTASGAKVGVEFSVPEGAADFQGASNVIALSATFLIAWTVEVSGVFTIKARRFAADGTAVASEFSVTDTDTKMVQVPALATFENGYVAVAWVGADSVIMYNQLLDASATKVGDAVSTPVCSDAQFSLDLAEVSSNRVVLVYQVTDQQLQWDVKQTRLTLSAEHMTCPTFFTVGSLEVAGSSIDGHSTVAGPSFVLTDIPATFAGTSAFFPTLPLAAGAELRFECCDTAIGGCDIFVVLPHCPPCTTGKNGGYPASLPADGWDAGSCAPRFESAVSHPSVAFHKRLLPGQQTSLPFTTSVIPRMATFASQYIAPDEWCPARAHQPKGPNQPVPCICEQ